MGNIGVTSYSCLEPWELAEVFGSGAKSRTLNLRALMEVVPIHPSKITGQTSLFPLPARLHDQNPPGLAEKDRFFDVVNSSLA